MERTIYPYYHAIRREDGEAWLNHRVTEVLTLCGLLCMTVGNNNLVYDYAEDFYEAPYKILFREMGRPVSDEGVDSFIKCPKCWAELPLVLLANLP